MPYLFMESYLLKKKLKSFLSSNKEKLELSYQQSHWEWVSISNIWIASYISTCPNHWNRLFRKLDVLVVDNIEHTAIYFWMQRTFILKETTFWQINCSKFH